MRRRRPSIAVGLILVLVATAGAAGCATDDRNAASGRGQPGAPTGDAPVDASDAGVDVPDGCEARSPDGARRGEIGDLDVVREERTVVDVGRPTEPRPDRAQLAAPDRTLPMVVLRPDGGGPHPLVVWSHGLGSAGSERNDTLERWASAGYVVVAPTFPLSSRSTDSSDLRNQPGDLAFVVESIRAAADDPADPLHGAVLGGCVALAGHSLGGGTTMAAAYDPCCSSIEPDALVDVAGVLVADTAGGRLVDMAPVPTLVVHGDADATVPYAQSQQTVASLHGPTWFLTFTGGGHSDMFEPPRSALLDDAVTAFLDARLRGDTAALDGLASVASASSQATLEVLAPR